MEKLDEYFIGEMRVTEEASKRNKDKRKGIDIMITFKLYGVIMISMTIVAIAIMNLLIRLTQTI